MEVTASFMSLLVFANWFARIAPRFDRDGTSPALQPQRSAAAVDCSFDAVTVASRPARHRQIAAHATDAGLGVDRERGIVRHDHFNRARCCFQSHISRHGRRQFRRNKSTGRFRFQFSANIRERELAAGAFDLASPAKFSTLTVPPAVEAWRLPLPPFVSILPPLVSISIFPSQPETSISPPSVSALIGPCSRENFISPPSVCAFTFPVRFVVVIAPPFVF